MKKLITFITITFIVGALFFKLGTNVQAQEFEFPDDLPEIDLSATDSAEATTSTKLASPSAEIEEKLQKKKDEDITETGGQQKSKLAAYLDEHPIGPLSWNNFVQHAVRKSIEKGLPANIIVLLILFPLIAAIISASRHIIGFRGFGIYIPAVLSVAFVSTGILTGTIIFIAVLLAAIMTRTVIRRLRLPYLPRRAMLLWGVSIWVLIILMLAAYSDVTSLVTINIFPLLIIMLLTENFMSSQLFNSQKEAFKLTVETLMIAIFCSLIISLDQVQQIVILRPELTFIAIAFANILTGKYSGLRLLEYLRFTPLFPTPTPGGTYDDEDQAE